MHSPTSSLQFAHIHTIELSLQFWSTLLSNGYMFAIAFLSDNITFGYVSAAITKMLLLLAG